MPDARDPLAPNPLEFVTADEMVAELGRRNEGVIVAVVKKRSEQAEGFQCWYRGGFTLALGIASRAVRDFNDKIEQKDKLVEEEDE